MLILNDIHVGFQRKGGTTPASQETLRHYLLTQFETTLDQSDEEHLFIAGDLFDDFEVSSRDWVATYSILSGWLSKGKRLTMIAGNHDHSPKALRVSSYEALAYVLRIQYPKFVALDIDHWSKIEPNVFALSHCSSQTVFEEKLNKILERLSGDEFFDDPIVFVHANYDNKFAAQADHSLNVTVEMATQFKAAGARLVFAHEHQHKRALGGSVYIMGNQWPTSVADCLGNEVKCAHRLVEGTLMTVGTWSREDPEGYAEVDWRDLADPELCTGFIKVVGDALASEASEVISAIAAFRARSDAFVITNGVKVDGIVEAESLPESFEAAKKFDVMEYIKQHLDAEEMVVVEDLMKEGS